MWKRNMKSFSNEALIFFIRKIWACYILDLAKTVWALRILSQKSTRNFGIKELWKPSRFSPQWLCDNSTSAVSDPEYFHFCKYQKCSSYICSGNIIWKYHNTYILSKIIFCFFFCQWTCSVKVCSGYSVRAINFSFTYFDNF